MWVTYKNGVYDVTELMKNHPGGQETLKLAAGGPLEPYWTTYRLHYEPKVQHLLETYKIGELPKEQILDFNDDLIPWPR